MDGYIEHYFMHIRFKDLILLIRKGLSYLFGTATHSDLRKIWINVDRLANNPKEIAHVVYESILIIIVPQV